MKIKWLGHSCFLLTSKTGVKILADPFNDRVGYTVPAVSADIVTTSHDHFDHGFVEAVRGPFVHIKEAGQYEEKGIQILGIDTYHDQEEGAKRGRNVVFKFTVDRLNVCHLGDLGHILSDEQVLALGQVDILLIPVGGTYTIDQYEAAEVVALIDPKLVIPMHYKTPVIEFPIDGVDKFLGVMGSVASLAGNELEITADALSQQAKVIVLNYPSIESAFIYTEDD